MAKDEVQTQEAPQESVERVEAASSQGAVEQLNSTPWDNSKSATWSPKFQSEHENQQVDALFQGRPDMDPMTRQMWNDVMARSLGLNTEGQVFQLGMPPGRDGDTRALASQSGTQGDVPASPGQQPGQAGDVRAVASQSGVPGDAPVPPGQQPGQAGDVRAVASQSGVSGDAPVPPGQQGQIGDTRTLVSAGQQQQGFGEMNAAPPVGEVGTLSPRADRASRIGDAAPRPDDRGDRRFSQSEMQSINDYSRTLRESGMGTAEANALARQTMDRLKENREHIKGTPEEQMNRANRAMADVLHHTGDRTDGQRDTLSHHDRQNMVLDAAHRFADPAKFVNQGRHMTCALESMQKQNLEGGDPARELEQQRDIVNNGSTTIREQNGRERTVHVDSRSYAPDGESGRDFDRNVHGSAGQRGMSGHVGDALYGQAAADLRAEREGLPTSGTARDGRGAYTYMAAHADELGARNGQTRTGEGLFRNNADGSHTMIASSPGVGLWDVAHLNRAMGGRDGAVFAHRDLAGGNRPPEGEGYPPDLTVTTFTGPQDFRQKLADWQNRTGQSAQIGVDAPFLPGGGQDGHGLHAMNASLERGADGKFHANARLDLDNNWGDQNDLKGVTDAQLNRATNPHEWRTRGGGGGPIPDGHTPFRPGDGRNPNETPAERDQRRRDEQKNHDRAEDEKKKLEEDAKKAREAKKENDPEKEKERQKQLMHALKLAAAQARYAAALASYEARQAAAVLAGAEFKEAMPQLEQVDDQ